eukprot:m.118069 g.118069  ORF g.118069 m.118069 type:complete len:108 (-) comp14270_c0_seq2:2850-3173(-)
MANMFSYYHVILVATISLVNGLYNGTPTGITTAFDCKAREFAWNYGKHLLPARGAQGFKTLYDALQLQGCPVLGPRPEYEDSWAPPPKEVVLLLLFVVNSYQTACPC